MLLTMNSRNILSIPPCAGEYVGLFFVVVQLIFRHNNGFSFILAFVNRPVWGVSNADIKSMGYSEHPFWLEEVSRCVLIVGVPGG